MAPPANTRDIGGRRRGLTVLAAAVLALGLAQDASGREPMLIAQAAEPADPEEINVLNWLGNLIGRGLSAPPRPAATPADQPAETDGKAAKENGTAITGSAPTLAQPIPATSPAAKEAAASVGLSLELGKMPPVGATSASCITKARETVRFCVEPAEWPDAMRPLVWVNSHMYQGTYGIVRYDNDRASYIHALIPTASYEAVVAWYTSRWGAPEHTGTRQAVRFNEPRSDNPIAVWQRPLPDGTPGPSLEIRRYDDTRGGFADSRHGVVMLYAPAAKPIFPQISSVELMALRIVEDAAERPDGAIDKAALPTKVATPSRPARDLPATVPPPQPAAPAPAASIAPGDLPPAPPSEANPFNPHNPVAPKLALGGVEAPVPAPAVKEAEPVTPGADDNQPAAAAETSDENLFSRLARFFDTTSPPAGSQAPDAAPRPTPQPARVDRTPDIRPPAHGFFTRLIRTYTDDGSEIARAGEGPAQGQMLRDVPLAIDERLRLGMNPPASGEGSRTVCLDKDGLFCLADPIWPPGPAAALRRTAGLPTIGRAALRFDLGRVSHIQLRFAGDEFDRVVAFFAERYGPPTERASPRAGTADENPTALWRSVNSGNGVVSTLEIRRYDDLMPEVSDSRVGVIRVYQDNSASLFPPLTSGDLSALP